MFCGKCGAQIPEGAAFCQQCGAPVGGGQQPAAAGADHAQMNLRYRNIGIAAVASVVVVAAVLLFTLLGGRGYKATVSKLMDAILDGDAKTIVRLVPDKIADSIFGSMKQDRVKALEEMGEDIQGRFAKVRQRLGNNWGISYEILDARDVSDSELRNAQSVYEGHGVKVSGAKYVTVKITVQIGDREGSSTIQIPVVKVGRSWYLDVNSLYSIIYSVFSLF